MIDNLADIWLIGKFGSTVSQSVCVLNNELTFTRFYIRSRRAFSRERGKKGIEEKERGATESGGVGWDIIPPRAPSRGGWGPN